VSERYCTLFDIDFLPMGLALYESLTRHQPQAVLWVLCLDDDTFRALQALRLPQARLVRLADIEDDRLRAVRGSRTRREYYWTLTPWMFDMVFDRDADASRVTYLDADLYFFQSPAVLLDAMTPSHEVLITDHAFAPQHDYRATSGRFCVQFVSARRQPAALQAVAWWRDRCLEWCHAEFDGERCGDQMYLEQWPSMLGAALLIVDRADLTGAPWNACLAERESSARWTPVFYHFHGFRYLSGDRVLLAPSHPAYEIGPKAWALYRTYVAAIRRASRTLRKTGIRINGSEPPQGYEDYDAWGTVLRRAARLIKRRLQPLERRPIVSVR
jgi:hypothetical protein